MSSFREASVTTLPSPCSLLWVTHHSIVAWNSRGSFVYRLSLKSREQDFHLPPPQPIVWSYSCYSVSVTLTLRGCGVVTVTCVTVTCHQHPPSCLDMSIISLGHRDDLEQEPVTPGGRAGPEEGQPWYWGCVA